MKTGRARDILGEHGPFRASVPGYQVRDGQLAVTDAVERLLEHDGSLLCEAGTGIGKTFAYLVPALLSGRKVVVSTATKALQDQIAQRDLPLVQRVLGTNASVAVMKGLGNYLCKRRQHEYSLSEEALRPSNALALRLLRDWSRSTSIGDFAELSSLSEESQVRLQVASSSETRVGPTCPHFDDCFVTTMKREAEAAQVVIVNHHLFFADLALRGPHPGRVIPDYDVALLDEAHQIEDTAALFFGIRVTSGQLHRLLREAERLFARASAFGGSLDPHAASSTISAAHLAAREFFEELARGGRLGRRVLSSDDWVGKLSERGHRVDTALDDLAAAARSRASTIKDDLSLLESLQQCGRRCDSVRDALEALRGRRDDRVTWVESDGAKVTLSSTPVDLSNLLRERLFEAVPAVALLSATLSTDMEQEDSGFAFVRSRLGLDESETVQELIVSSPFAYERQCAVYLPNDLPRPGTEEFLDQSAVRIAELVALIDGGAFVLTTSLAAMRGLHGRIREHLGPRLLLLQGERPKDALLSTFRNNGSAVLVATSSFWEGVDVPGSALRLVVLEKIPFAVPSDPIFEARARVLEEQGKNAFLHLAVPSAALSLKQGFGRLIRREDDVGIVALLDERVHTKGYGKKILRALPSARRTSSLDEVRTFTSAWSPA